MMFWFCSARDARNQACLQHHYRELSSRVDPGYLCWVDGSWWVFL